MYLRHDTIARFRVRYLEVEMIVNPGWMQQLEALCVPYRFSRVVFEEYPNPSLSGTVEEIMLAGEQLTILTTRVFKRSAEAGVPAAWVPYLDSHTFTIPLISLIRPPFEFNGDVCLQAERGITINLTPNVT